jgi:hypothetical protein
MEEDMNTQHGLDYNARMKGELLELVNALDIDKLQNKFLQSRWLDQFVWMKNASNKNQRKYYLLRLSCIIGGVIIPALVGLNLAGGWDIFIRIITVVISLIVAVSAAIEEFFHFGDRWRHYRRSVGQLKTEVWLFFQLSGPYESFSSHQEAYPIFARRMEETFQNEMDTFITKISKEEQKKRVET